MTLRNGTEEWNTMMKGEQLKWLQKSRAKKNKQEQNKLSRKAAKKYEIFPQQDDNETEREARDDYQFVWTLSHSTREI